MLEETWKTVIDGVTTLTGYAATREWTPSPRPGEHILDLKAYTQVNSFCCGAVAGFMVVKSLYSTAVFGRFYDLVKPDKELGSSPRDLRRALRQSGVCVKSPRLTYEALLIQIREGRPAIVVIRNPSAENRHYVVAYGFGNGRILLASNGVPWVHRKWYGREEFTSMWDPRGNAMVCWAIHRITGKERGIRVKK